MSSIVVPIGDPSAVGAARRVVVDCCRTVGLPETQTAKVALLATEAGTNLVKHAQGGWLVIQPAPPEAPPGIVLVVVDRGPGIDDVAACMRDGYSTAGSPGTGLGAMARLADRFDVYSSPRGTIVFAAIGGPDGDDSGFVHGGLAVPHPSEDECGDGFAVVRDGARLWLMVVDGLGHGPVAAAAARTAERLFHEGTGRTPGAVLERLHDGLRHTRGAAGAVAEIDTAAGVVRFAGVGNIVASRFAPGSMQHMVSHHGTLGHAVRRVQEFEYAWNSDSVLVLHSDGIASHWSLDDYPGLPQRHPLMLATALHRDHRRGRDDATVLVAREVP